MERKYLLKLEGRSTRNSEVFSTDELNILIDNLAGCLAFDLSVHGSKEDPLNVALRKLIDVLKYTKPCD